MKRKILSDIAEIRFGINARTQSQGDVLCLQGKDFDDLGELNATAFSYIDENQCKDTDLLQHGDVLFAAKGSRNYAVTWNDQLPKAVASSTFFVMRMLDKNVLPEYLAWYLMSAHAARHFEKNIKQATVRSVSKSDFENLQIKVPAVSRQEAIIKLHKIYLKDLKLQSRRSEILKKLIFNLIV